MKIYLNPLTLQYSLSRLDGFTVEADLSNDVEVIMKAIEARLGVNYSELFDGRRNADKVKQRALVYYHARMAGLRFVDIAKYCRVNHGTVIFHFYKVLDYAQIYPEWKRLTSTY
jgi:hypothetical protein